MVGVLSGQRVWVGVSGGVGVDVGEQGGGFGVGEGDRQVVGAAAQRHPEQRQVPVEQLLDRCRGVGTGWPGVQLCGLAEQGDPAGGGGDQPFGLVEPGEQVPQGLPGDPVQDGVQEFPDAGDGPFAAADDLLCVQQCPVGVGEGGHQVPCPLLHGRFAVQHRRYAADQRGAGLLVGQGDDGAVAGHQATQRGRRQVSGEGDDLACQVGDLVGGEVDLPVGVHRCRLIAGGGTPGQRRGDQGGLVLELPVGCLLYTS